MEKRRTLQISNSIESLLRYEERRKRRIESERSPSKEAPPITSQHQPDSPPDSSDVVEESVVTSRNAISEWEKRITQKEEKVKQEEQILGVGAARRWRDEKTHQDIERCNTQEPGKSGGMSRVNVVSSHAVCQNVIDQEIKDAAEREELWRMENSTGFKNGISPTQTSSTEMVNEDEPIDETQENKNDETSTTLATITQQEHVENSWNDKSENGLQITHEDVVDASSRPFSGNLSQVNDASENACNSDDVIESDYKADVDIETAAKSYVDTETADKTDVDIETADKSDVDMEMAAKSSVDMQTAAKSSIDMETVAKTDVYMQTAAKTNVNMETSDESEADTSTTEKIITDVIPVVVVESEPLIDTPVVAEIASQNSLESPAEITESAITFGNVSETQKQPEINTAADLTLNLSSNFDMNKRLTEPSPSQAGSETIEKISTPTENNLRFDDKALLMSPKGWGGTSPTVKSVSPTFFRGKRSPSSTPSDESKPHSGAHTSSNIPDEAVTLENHHPITKFHTSEATSPLRSGPSFEVTSSRSHPETIMLEEMQEAKKREEEWRLHEREVLHIDPHSPVFSPTPMVGSDKEQEVQNGEGQKSDVFLPNKVSANEANDVKPPTPTLRTKLSFQNKKGSDDVDSMRIGNGDDAPVVRMRSGSSAEYRKKAVVKANRVPRRKSMLAQRWEAGRFLNNED